MQSRNRQLEYADKNLIINHLLLKPIFKEKYKEFNSKLIHNVIVLDLKLYNFRTIIVLKFFIKKTIVMQYFF
jgi:hypothetical protein